MCANIKKLNFRKVIPRKRSLSKGECNSKPVQEITTGIGIRENILALSVGRVPAHRAGDPGSNLGPGEDFSH